MDHNEIENLAKAEAYAQQNGMYAGAIGAAYAPSFDQFRQAALQTALQFRQHGLSLGLSVTAEQIAEDAGVFLRFLREGK